MMDSSRLLILISTLLSSGLAAKTNVLEISCASQTSHWCSISKISGNYTNNEHIIISPRENLNNVRNFSWTCNSILTGLNSVPEKIMEVFPRLRSLKIRCNVDTVEAGDFRYGAYVEHLNLDHNLIETLKRDAFAYGYSLGDIHINDNLISEIEDDAFRDLYELHLISLNDNFIRTLRRNTFRGAPSLTEIRLRRNSISFIEDGSLNLPLLSELYLGNNKLRTLPGNLFDRVLSVIDVVDLSNNAFGRVPQAILTTPSIRFLNLDNNVKLRIRDLTQFTQVSELQYLSLENVGLQLPLYRNTPYNFSNTSISFLDLDNNNLITSDILYHLSLFKSLKVVHLNNNLIERINGIENINELIPSLKSISILNNVFDQKWFGKFNFSYKDVYIFADTDDKENDKSEKNVKKSNSVPLKRKSLIAN